MSKWTDNLPSVVYNRLADCVNTKADVPVLIDARWKWMQDNGKAGTKEDAVVYVFELLDSNSQGDLCDVSRAEYNELIVDPFSKKVGMTAADFKIAKRYAKAVEEDAKEINALFKYDNPGMVDLNKGRILVTIREAIDALERLEKLMIKGKVNESVVESILGGASVRKVLTGVNENAVKGKKDPYKVNVIDAALEGYANDEYFLAKLKADGGKAINIEPEALQILKAYYSGKQISVTGMDIGVSKSTPKKKAASPIKEAFAVYTGGNIWLFYGQLKNGNYFLTDDYGATRILNADPSDLDESTYEEWQQEHLVKDLTGKELLEFDDALLDWLITAPQKNRGGITDQEIEYYRNYFKEA